MAAFVFVKTECETVDVKEEYVEEEDPLMIATFSEKGDTNLKCLKLCIICSI